MAKRIITGSLFVSLSDYSDPDQLASPDDATALKALSFTNCDITGDGYSKAGTATVTVELDDEKELIESKAESLRAAFEKRQTTPTSQCVGLTRKQMLDWDEKSLLAGQWRLT